MGQSGTIALKSFQTFQVNDGLLTKVVEAIQAGEKRARTSGDVQSFEVFYHGFRQNISIGRIYVVPASVADKLEGFPTALLYGCLVREFSGEAVSDLISKKIGDNEFDEYSEASMSAIKDQLFKDSEGKFTSLILFAANWVNKREYVAFKFVKDTVALSTLVRHLVFGAYYDPRLSSAFNSLMTDVSTDRLDVTDITPKLPYPEIIAGVAKSSPVLESSITAKTGSIRKKIALTFKNADAITQEILTPPEMDVIESLDVAMAHALGVKSPEEAGREHHGESEVPHLAADNRETKSKEACEAEHGVPAGVSNVGPDGSAASTAKKNPSISEKKFNEEAAEAHEVDEKPIGIELNTDGTPKRKAAQKTAGGGEVRLANNTQVWLWKDELEGQMSDGMWENSSPWEHWKAFSGATVTVGEPGLSNIHPRRTYGFRRLVSILGDRMLLLAKFSKAYPNLQPESVSVWDLEHLVQKNPDPEALQKLETVTGDTADVIKQKIEAVRYSQQDLMRDLRQIENVVNGGYRAAHGGAKTASDKNEVGEYKGHTFRLTTWEERDRLNVSLEDECCGKEILDVWDDDARSMFEDGFFDVHNLFGSVLEYAESVGLLKDIQPKAGEDDEEVTEASVEHWNGTQQVMADARSARSKKQSSKREAKLAKLRGKNAEQVPDADDVLSEVLMDMGQAPVIDTEGEGSPKQPSSGGGAGKAAPSEVTSDKPEETKSVSESEEKNAVPASKESYTTEAPAQTEETPEKSHEPKTEKPYKTEDEPKTAEFQPKTGAPCSCRPGRERDNCPRCEGTGMVVDFAAIRNKTKQSAEKACTRCGHVTDDLKDGLCSDCRKHFDEQKELNKNSSLRDPKIREKIAAYVKSANISVAQGEDEQGFNMLITMNGREYVLRGDSAESFRREYAAIPKPEDKVNNLVMKYMDQLRPYKKPAINHPPTDRSRAEDMADSDAYWEGKEKQPNDYKRYMTQHASTKVAYVAHVPGHKDSEGNAAPWVVKQHNTGKILESFSSKEKAEDGLKNMESHKHGSGHVEDAAKLAGFNFYFPGQALREFYPELQHTLVDYPNENNAPMIEDVDVHTLESSLDTTKISYVSTSPAGAMGIGRDGKEQVLEGAPLRKRNDIRGPMFMEEFYNHLQPGPDGDALKVMSSKVAASEEPEQFALFLKKVLGEIAATMVAAFKATSRPLMDKVPGEGEIQLAEVEKSSAGFMAVDMSITNTASRVKYLLGKLTDSQIQDAINSAWAQAAVWHDESTGGFVYEVFCRAESIDTDTMIMKYQFVIGTREGETKNDAQ